MRYLVLVLLVASCKPASKLDRIDPPASPSRALAAANENVVQREMKILTKVLEATVRGIGAGDVRAIAGQLHELHAAKEATSAAVASGAYRLPKSPENVAAFTAMDEAFHEHLGALVVASRANDVPAAAEAFGAIMRGCHGCHTAFRN